MPVELSGRGWRISEPFYSEMEELTADLLTQLRPLIEQQPYAFFGHSMGGLIVYTLTKAIKDAGLPMPHHLFVSGIGAPHVLRPDKVKYHTLSTPDFIKAVVELGETPPDLFENEELLDFFLPLLRSDFKIAETEIQQADILSLDVPLSIFTGDQDDLTSEQISGWKYYTNKSFEIETFSGGHFFINDHVQSLLQFIAKRLKYQHLYCN